MAVTFWDDVLRHPSPSAFIFDADAFCKSLPIFWVREKLRGRYDWIVDFEPISDGFGITRDAQTAKPQAFRTGTVRSRTTWQRT